jgi:hypothetical protein
VELGSLRRRNRLPPIGGLLGTVALAEERIQAFEAEIAQPLAASHSGKRIKQVVPEQLEAQTARMGSTNTGYLMARLLRLDPEVANKIGTPAGAVCLEKGW